MSLRRSARVSAMSSLEHIAASGQIAEQNVPKKRGRNSKPTKGIATPVLARDGVASKVELDSQQVPPPPVTPTPNKRRKIVKEMNDKLPPFTRTPSAIGLMLNSSAPGNNYSSGDIEDPDPPPTRPIEPHHTNATLITPGGSQLQPSYSNFEEPSPSKRLTTKTTSKTLLDEACAHLVKVAPNLKPVIDRHHCRVFSPEGLAEEIDPFRSLTSGIMAQQVSGAAAKSIKNKFIALFPAEKCPKGFPPPFLVAETDLATLRSAGLSQRKAEYIQGLAEKFSSGAITPRFLMTASDEDVMQTLVAIRGLGAWSVEMFMCFGLKRLDVFSTGDLGVQRGMAAFKGRDVAKLKAKGGGKWKYMSETEMVEIADAFRPYRSLFMWYMWRVENVDVDAVQDN